jgi:hypothetical protein
MSSRAPLVQGEARQADRPRALVAQLYPVVGLSALVDLEPVVVGAQLVDDQGGGR